MSQAHTLHDDAALDAVSALGVLCLTLIGTFILEADTGDLQSGLGCGPLRGQGAIYFAPLDSGDRAGRGDKTRGGASQTPLCGQLLEPRLSGPSPEMLGRWGWGGGQPTRASEGREEERSKEGGRGLSQVGLKLRQGRGKRWGSPLHSTRLQHL